MRRETEIDTIAAAELLEVHPETMRRWARAVIDGSVSRSRVTIVRQDLVGHFYFDRAEVADLARACGRTEDDIKRLAG